MRLRVSAAFLQGGGPAPRSPGSTQPEFWPHAPLLPAESGEPLVSQRSLCRAVRHQSVGRDAAELAGLEIFDGLDDLGLGVHHERAVMEPRVADGPGAEGEALEG